MLYAEIPDNQIFKLLDQWFESCQDTKDVEKMLWYVMKELTDWEGVNYTKLRKHCDDRIRMDKVAMY